MSSYYEIGGILFDGSYGYDHRKFKRVRRLIEQTKPGLATAVITQHLVDLLDNSDKEIPYSDSQLAVRDFVKTHRTRYRKAIAAMPLPPVLKAPLMVLPEVANMYSYAVGSYEMYTPEIQAYEDSVTFSSMTSRQI